MTAEIMTAEEDFGEHCLRIRYEDLVSDPETVMDGIFKFLGASPVPDIVARCFSSEQERLGMADYKVWHTNRVSSDSVGRGWNIPPGLIPEPVLDGVNELAGRLGLTMNAVTIRACRIRDKLESCVRTCSAEK